MLDIRFGPFVLDADASRLLRDDVEVKLRPQALLALKTLALHSGRYVGYERMIADAWDGNVVSRHTVDVTVGEVRRTLLEYGSWIGHRPKIGYCLAVPHADERIRRGQHLFNLRTREGMERALDSFQEAAADDSSDFRAFEGQAACYLMLGSQGMRPPHQMYAAFLAAYRQAEALAGPTPDLRCHRAHGLHMFERRIGEAEAEFRAALLERPTLGPAYVRLALLYAATKRSDEALACLERAHAVTPLLPLVPAGEVYVRFLRREFDQAAAIGATAVELHPYLQLGRVFYAQALEFAGRLDEALEQYHLGWVMSPDLSWLRAFEGACLVKRQRYDEARSILGALEQRRRSEYVDAYGMAVLRHALGQTDEAFAELARAIDENSASLFTLDADPKMDPLRADPRFARLQRRLVEDSATALTPMAVVETAAGS